MRSLRKTLAATAALLRSMLHARARSEALTRLRFGDRFFQSVSQTEPNRFPVLFGQCKILLEDIAAPRVLSFGCSTGDEVASLATYLPDAMLVGVDINAWCLRQCRKRISRSKTFFLHRSSREFAECEAFDAIFCMAVFQRAEHRVEQASPAETGFTFKCFEEELRFLDGKLKMGGFLFIDHADFSFGDTALAARYRTVSFEGSQRRRERVLFGRDNRPAAESYVAERCFQKQA